MDHHHLSFAGLTATLKAAAEPTRLRILALLAEAELTVSDLTEILRQSQPRLSRHLRLLTEAGLVDRFRVVVFPVITGSSGRERIYDGYPDVALDMISSRTFDGRIQLLEYVPTILAGPPGGQMTLGSTE